MYIAKSAQHCVRLCTLSLCTRCRSCVAGLTPPPRWASWSRECPPSHCGRTCADWSSSDRRTVLYCGPAKMQTGKISKGLYAVRTEFNCRLLSSRFFYQGVSHACSTQLSTCTHAFTLSFYLPTPVNTKHMHLLFTYLSIYLSLYLSTYPLPIWE